MEVNKAASRSLSVVQRGGEAKCEANFTEAHRRFRESVRGIPKPFLLAKYLCGSG